MNLTAFLLLARNFGLWLSRPRPVQKLPPSFGTKELAATSVDLKVHLTASRHERTFKLMCEPKWHRIAACRLLGVEEHAISTEQSTFSIRGCHSSCHLHTTIKMSSNIQGVKQTAEETQDLLHA
eukprot:scaffold66756_cov49-Attheya_sp.AAC.2